LDTDPALEAKKEFIMSIRSLLITTALAAFVAMPVRSVRAASEQESHSSWCMLASLQVTQVAALYATEVARAAPCVGSPVPSFSCQHALA